MDISGKLYGQGNKRQRDISKVINDLATASSTELYTDFHIGYQVIAITRIILTYYMTYESR